jgi:hypothetical protein
MLLTWSSEEDAASRQPEAGSAVHRSLDELEAVHLPPPGPVGQPV